MRGRLHAHRPIVRCALTACALLVASHARAQSDGEPAAAAPELVVAPRSQGAEPVETILLLAPYEVRVEWTAALQLELAARGAIAIPGEPPLVDTLLAGDAQAQRLALDRGASTAVWVQELLGSWRLRLIRASDESARVVPVARDADARTVALIIVSLLDATEELPARAPAARVAPVAPDASLSTSTSPHESVALPENAAPGRPPRAEPYVRWSGRVGVAGFMYYGQGSVNFGGGLRAGIALRYGEFEAAILHDLGLYNEALSEGSTQPLMRGCLELGGATPRVALAFHAGARACLGSVFATTRSFSGTGEFFQIVGARSHITGGAYAGLSLALSSWIRVFVRADLDVGWTDLPSDSVSVVPALSTILSFE